MLDSAYHRSDDPTIDDESPAQEGSGYWRSVAMLFAAAFLVVGGFAFGCGSTDGDECGADDDCKGDRICEEGACTDPGGGSGGDSGGDSGSTTGGDTGGSSGGDSGGSSGGDSKKSVGDACEYDSNCQTDLCYTPGLNTDGYCSKTCTDSFDCPDFWDCKDVDGNKICVND